MAPDYCHTVSHCACHRVMPCDETEKLCHEVFKL